MKTLSIQYNGSVTFWSPKGCQLAALETAMSAAGLGDIVPQARTDMSSLRLACEKYADVNCPQGQEWEVRPLLTPGVNGYETTWITRGEVRNTRTHAFSCAVDNGFVKTTDGYASSPVVQAYFNMYKALVTPESIGKTLVRIATDKLDGLCLRPSGGLYWIPDDHVGQWSLYAQVIENASGTAVTTAAWEANASTIGCVRESLLSTVEAECKRLMVDLSDGKQHSDLFFHSRAQDVQRLLQRVETVESALQESLVDCRVRLELVQSVFTAATVAAL